MTVTVLWHDPYWPASWPLLSSSWLLLSCVMTVNVLIVTVTVLVMTITLIIRERYLYCSAANYLLDPLSFYFSGLCYIFEEMTHTYIRGDTVCLEPDILKWIILVFRCLVFVSICSTKYWEKLLTALWGYVILKYYNAFIDSDTVL